MKRSYLLLTLFTSVLLVLGFVFIYSAGISMEARLPYLSARGFLTKQLIAFVIGLTAAVVIVHIKSSTHFKNVFYVYYPTIIFLLVAVLLFPSRGGSHRWIELGAFSLQVSEFAKIVLIMALAKYFGWIEEKNLNFLRTFIVPLLIAAPFIFLVFIEPDLSTTGLLILITIVMMFLGGIKVRHILLAVVLTVVLIFVAYRLDLLRSYQIERFITFISSFRGQEHEQISYSLKAISAGGLLGTGLGMGTVKYYLPVSYSDFIFATIGEELGLVGIFLLMISYIGFVQKLVLIGLKVPKKKEGKLYIIGFAFYVMMQATINIAVNLGLFPPTGVTLPFVSYGGSSLVSLLIGFAFVFSIILEREEGYA